jgi:hypothetical protein
MEGRPGSGADSKQKDHSNWDPRCSQRGRTSSSMLLPDIACLMAIYLVCLLVCLHRYEDVLML